MGVMEEEHGEGAVGDRRETEREETFEGENGTLRIGVVKNVFGGVERVSIVLLVKRSEEVACVTQ